MKAILFNSGGLDSLCTAKILRTQFPDLFIQSIFLSHGGKYEDIICETSKLVAKEYCDNHREFYFREKNSDGTFQNTGGVPLDHPRYKQITYRSLNLLQFGYSFALVNDFDTIFLGLKSIDYQDNLVPAFLKLAKTSKMREFNPNLKIEFPIWDYSQDKVFDIIKDDPLLTKVYSCMRVPECGICLKCEWRKRYGIEYDGGYFGQC